ncbi:MAG TPA: hypothetical protein VKE94_15965, partial [Gemmataceae bacterium]|nr:hypothetical protein [Gemmataceae bacterium]
MNRRRTRLGIEGLEDRCTPATLTVNTLGDNIDHTDSVLTLREAIDVVNTQSNSGLSTNELAQISGTLGSKDTIQFAPSLFTSQGQTIKLSITGNTDNLYGDSAFAFNTEVTIEGPTGTNGLTLDGGGKRLFEVTESGNLKLDDLTLTDSVSNGRPGGAIVNLGKLELTSSTVRGCSAALGGGLYNLGTASLSSSFFEFNSAGSGGA